MNTQETLPEMHLDQVLILMYHRIADTGLDPWQLCVSPEKFRQQLEQLSQQFEFIKLSDIPACGDLSNKLVITFDDGYADNLLVAKPILEEFSAPATVFVTSGYVGGEREFWWDELEQLILQLDSLPNSLSLDMESLQLQFDFKQHGHYSEELAAIHRDWKVTYDGSHPPTERHELFLNLWAKLQVSSEGTRRKALESLFLWAGREPIVRLTHRPMGKAELVEITQNGLIEIGSHGVTHCAFPSLDSESKRMELESSKMELETILDRKVTSFAYPHGEYDLETIRLVEELGYDFALGTGKPKFPNWKRFQLPRVMAMNRGIRGLSARMHLEPS